MFSFSCCGSRVVSWHKVTVDTERTSVRQLGSAFCSAQTYIKRNVKYFNKKRSEALLLRNFSDIIKINIKLVPFWTTISAQRLVDAVSVTHQQKMNDSCVTVVLLRVFIHLPFSEIFPC